MSDTAHQRRREFAIRIALGAGRFHIIFQLVRDGGRLACAGTVAGTLAALLLSRLLTRITPASGSAALWVWRAAPFASAVSGGNCKRASRARRIDRHSPHNHAS
jgi:ABC-type antimicrobial peptide transport system permease subunit